MTRDHAALIYGKAWHYARTDLRLDREEAAREANEFVRQTAPEHAEWCAETLPGILP